MSPASSSDDGGEYIKLITSVAMLIYHELNPDKAWQLYPTMAQYRVQDRYISAARKAILRIKERT